MKTIEFLNEQQLLSSVLKENSPRTTLDCALIPALATLSHDYTIMDHEDLNYLDCGEFAVVFEELGVEVRLYHSHIQVINYGNLKKLNEYSYTIDDIRRAIHDTDRMCDDIFACQ